MKKIFLLLALSFSVLESCQTVVVIDQKEFTKRLILTSTLNPDTTISVFVTRNVGPLATGMPDSITNATVELYQDGTLIDIIPYASNGNYDSNVIPMVGKEYRVTVSAPNFENNIEATTSIPAAPLIDTFTADIVPGEWGQYALEGSITINDPAGENYYMIQAMEDYTDTFSSEPYKSIVYLNTDDPLVSSISYYGSALMLTDFSFDQTQYKLQFKADYINGTGTGYHLSYKIFSLSKDTYLYLVSLGNYYNNKDNPFSEPVQVYSNVSSEMGILGAVNLVVKSVY